MFSINNAVKTIFWLEDELKDATSCLVTRGMEKGRFNMIQVQRAAIEANTSLQMMQSTTCNTCTFLAAQRRRDSITVVGHFFQFFFSVDDVTGLFCKKKRRRKCSMHQQLLAQRPRGLFAFLEKECSRKSRCLRV